MKYVYSRVANAGAAGLLREIDAGWLGGASGRGLPQRRPWVADGGRYASGDIWRELASATPAPRRRPSASSDGHQSYILQQNHGGDWLLDAWPETEAAAVCLPSHDSSAQSDTCFIIELEHATEF